MKTWILIFLVTTIFSISYAQTYWQQEVNYKIDVTLDDKRHILNGIESFEYINNSPQALTYLYIHLWPNGYLNNSTAFAKQENRNNKRTFLFSKKHNRGGIDSLNFKVNNQTVKWYLDENNPDICKIELNEPLVSGAKILVSTPFRVKLPFTFSRLGHVLQSYQISQWHPKPAVYDANGWNAMPYLDQGEFYSEFGSFDVKITLPENYVVGATGELQNNEEWEWLKARQNKKIPFDSVFISSQKTKTLHYKQNNIHDFAWFADKNYAVKFGEIELPNSKRKVISMLLYTHLDEEKVSKAMKDLHDATYYYSKLIGDYPYNYVTSVTGALGAGGGMEYPMITVTDPFAIIHEVGHNWFYGILATNERNFGWLDEGFNSFYEHKVYNIQNENNKTNNLQDNTKSRKNIDVKVDPAIEFICSRNLDQPISYHSNKYSNLNYYFSLYVKPVELLHQLEQFLGKNLFDSCMQTYFNEWKFKHPTIENFVETVNKTSGKDVSYLIELTKAYKNVDFKVKNTFQNNGVLSFDVVNNSKIKSPFSYSVKDKEGNVLQSGWSKSADLNQKITIQNEEEDVLVVVNEEKSTIEKTYNNNFQKTYGLFSKGKSIRFQIGFSEDLANKCEIFHAPMMGINTFDGPMFGWSFYNSAIHQKLLSYFIAPMYGIKSKKITGIGSVYKNFHANSSYHNYRIGLEASTFVQLQKFNFLLEEWYKIGISRHKIKLQSAVIQNKNFTKSFLLNPSASYNFYRQNALSKTESKLVFEHLQYVTEKNESSNENSALRLMYNISYKYRFIESSYLKIRLFAGYNFVKNSSFLFGLSSGLDYGFNHYFYDRMSVYKNTSAFVKQTNGEDGGFKSYIPIFSNSSLFSAIYEVKIPKIPLTIYSEHAFFENKLYKSAGASLVLIEDYLEIYFPVYGDGFAKKSPKTFKEFSNQIRWKLNIPIHPNVNEEIWKRF